MKIPNDAPKLKKFDTIKARVDGIPHMSEEQAVVITNTVLENKFQNILELGFRHGVSTCYMAGALEQLGGGHITTIDLTSAITAKPNIEDLLKELGLEKYVTVHYDPTSYLWEMLRMLEADPNPRFDFCYMDGAHSWAVDGFAFFLVDRLLKPGGMVIFDDLDWSYATSPTMKDLPETLAMSDYERTALQVRKVYEVLCKQHPSYGDFYEKDGWAFARKLANASGGQAGEIRKEVVVQTEHIGLGAALLKIAKKAKSYTKGKPINK